MVGRIGLNVFTFVVVIFAQGAHGQDKPPDLTPAGKAIMQGIRERPFYQRVGSTGPLFPLATCMFPGGLCGAVRRDGTVAIAPRYDWVGTFSESRAIVRVGGLYGDEDGREVVKPQYRMADDYKFGFAQVDVDGKSGLINRDGTMVIAPKYGLISAIAPDRFAVSERRELGGMVGGENFSGTRVAFTAAGGASVSVIGLFLDPENIAGAGNMATDVIDLSEQRIEPATAPRIPTFDKDDPSIRWVQSGKLWGLARADGSWLVEPKFQQPGSLTDGLARATLNGKVGFIDRSGNFVIEPVFDKVGWFTPAGRASAVRDGIHGVIDKTGAWVFKTDYQQVDAAVDYRDGNAAFGWDFKQADRWGLLDIDGRVVLGADLDQSVQHCPDGRLVALKNKEWLYFNSDGSPLQPPDGRLIDASCGSLPPYTLKIGDKFGLVDARSNPVTPVQFDALVSAGAGMKNVKIDGKWGRIRFDGRWLLEPKFDYLSSGVDVFVASVDGKRGFMRSDGSWLIEPKFDAARRRDDETALVSVSGATGMLRLKDQSWIVPPRPGVMCDINNAIMSQADGKRVILSRSGETWIDIGAERVGLNLDFGLLTFLRDGKWGLVDTAGQVMVEPQFDEPIYFAPVLRGVAWAKRDGNWCAIDRHGHSVPGIACAAADPTGWSRSRFECKVEP
jgi:hypothetical protein